MNDLVSLGDTLKNLEPAFGFSGAIGQILQALRNDELHGICDQFAGLNPSAFAGVIFPDYATDYELPSQFWGNAHWLNNGETSYSPFNNPIDVWATKADWRRGNFAVSGSCQRGKLPVSRLAKGVRLLRNEVATIFAVIGITPNWSSEIDGSRRDAETNRKPGRSPDPDWPAAIDKVKGDCIAAGYKRTRRRGDKAAIQTMLLNYMANRDKHFSDDTAAKHAETVIAALPDN